MATFLDLAELFNPQLGGAPPPALTLGNIALDRDTAISDQAFSEGQLLERLPFQLQSVDNAFAARGVSRHGQNTKQQGMVLMDANQQVAQGRYDLNKTLQQLARDRYLATIGLPIGGV